MKRHRRIGGTDAARVLGMSKYGGPIDVYARIAEGRDNVIDPFTAARGQLLEPAIRELSRMKWGWEYEPRDYSKPHIVYDAKREWAAASPDDLLRGEQSGVDYKSVDPRAVTAYGEEETDQVPPDAFIQAVHYCAVFDIPRWYIVAYFGGNDLRRYVIDRDQEVERLWEDACAKFWERHIVAKRPPPVDASDQYLAWLLERRPELKGPAVYAGESAEKFAQQLLKARQEQARWAEVESMARNSLVSLMGDGARLVGDGWSLGIQERSSTSWKSVVDELSAPTELVQKHTKKNRFPVFREGKQ